MKIKRERQVRLDELLRLVWDGEVVGEKFYDQEKNVLFIDKHDGEIKQADYTCKTDFFTITEEVEITEETKLDLVDIYKDYGLPLQLAFEKNISIKGLLEVDKGSKLDTIYIHLQNPDGTIGDLIWTKERGLVD